MQSLLFFARVFALLAFFAFEPFIGGRSFAHRTVFDEFFDSFAEKVVALRVIKRGEYARFCERNVLFHGSEQFFYILSVRVLIGGTRVV